MESGLLLSMAGIVLMIIFWFVTPASTKEALLKVLTLFSVNKDVIVDLENRGLIIENKELLQNRKLLNKKNYIYFPAVPTDNPNIIHATFIHYLNSLSKAGLKVVVLVFDVYYQIINQLSGEKTREDIRQFVSSLKQMGLTACRYEIIYESNILNRKMKRADILLTLLEHFGFLSKGHFENIASFKHHVSDDAPFIRYMKPILNMLYLAVSEKPYGFTLSGYDEKALWDIYQLKLAKTREYKLTNVFIPTMRSTLNEETNVLDKKSNVNFCDSLNDIVKKISTHRFELDNGGVLYALKYLCFAEGNVLTVDNGKGNLTEYRDLDRLLEDLRSNTVSIGRISLEVATVMYRIFHPKEKSKRFLNR